jgi:hypothetical protein
VKSLELNRCFGGNCRHHLRDQRINSKETGVKALLTICCHAEFFLRLFLDPKVEATYSAETSVEFLRITWRRNCLLPLLLEPHILNFKIYLKRFGMGVYGRDWSRSLSVVSDRRDRFLPEPIKLFYLPDIRRCTVPNP